MARRNSTLGRSVLDLDIDDSAFHSKLSGAARAAGKFTEQSGASLMKAGRAISGVGNAMVTNVTVPILAAGGAVAHFALDFDTTMHRIVGLAKVPKDAIAGVREEILAMGQDIGRSPQELAEAFYFVASAGFEAEEAMEVLRISATASAAGMGQVQDIAKTLGGVINAYGHENLSAAKAGDILTAAIQDGAAKASDFAGVIGFVVPVAASLGVSFDQVTAALAAMTQVGISADTAATNLGQVLAALQKPTNQAEDAMKGLGLSSAGLREQLREKGLLSTLRTLEERFAGNETAAAAVFGNIRALRGVTALLSLDTEQLNGIFADTAGALDTLSGAYEDTEGAQRDIDRSLAKLQASAIELGTDVLPLVVEVLGEVADAVSGLAGWWKTLDKGTKDLIVRSLAFLAVMGPVLVVVGKLVSGLGALLKVVGLLVGINGIPAVATAAARAKLVMLGWVGVIAAVGLALNSVTDDVSYFFDELFNGKKATKTLKDLMKIVGDPKMAIALRGWGVSVEQFTELVEKADGDVGDAFNAIKDNAGDLGKALTKLWAESEAAAEGSFRGWGSRSREVGQAAIEAGRAAKEIPENVSAELIDGAFVVGEAAEVMVDPVAEAVEKAKQSVADAANDLIHTLAATLSSNPQELIDAANEMWDDILRPFPDIKHRLTLEGILANKNLIKGLTSTDSGDRARTAEYFKGILAEYELLAPGALAAGELINPALKAGIDKNLDALTTYLETTTGEITNQFDLADELDRMGYDGLASYVRGVERARIDKLMGEISAIQKAAREGLGVGFTAEAYNAGYNVGTSYGDGLAAAQGYVNDKARQIKAGVQRFLEFAGSPAYTHSREIGEGVGESWGDGIARAITAAQRAIESRVGMVGDALAIAPRIAAPAMAGVSGVGLAGVAPVGAALGGGSSLTITGGIHLSGIGSDVSADAARRFAQSIHDELANTLQEQGARFPNRPRVNMG